MSSRQNIAIIGGSGLSEFSLGKVQGSRETPYGQTSADIILSKHGERSCLFLARHGSPHTIAPHNINYRANLWALKQLEVSHIISVNAVGGINPRMPASSIVLPHQLIDYSWGREQSFFDGVSKPLQHVDFTYPFSPKLSRRIEQVAANHAIAVHRSGVYGVTQGPRLETAAEIQRMSRDGCDIVGMTAMPEAILARELDIEYASICLVVNPAAGCSEALISMAEINKVLSLGMGTIRQLLEGFVVQA